LENLIRAAVLLRERIPNIFIAIGGTGPLAETLAASIVELGLQNTVRMLGRISEDDLPSVYGAADLFVVPTVALEGFGLVVVEALACGTPVLVTPVGGLPSVVRALEPGLILESAQPQHLANGIGAALAGTLPLPSAKRCVAYARNFSWSAISRLVSDVYREVAAPHALDAGDTNLRIKAPFELVR
jgi:glycosyltransferase involved in cell wall biosynthesis